MAIAIVIELGDIAFVLWNAAFAISPPLRSTLA